MTLAEIVVVLAAIAYAAWQRIVFLFTGTT